MSRPRGSRLWAWVGAVAVAAAALLYGSVDDGPPRTNADQAYALAQDFACPVCDGQSVAESDHPVARNIRRQIGQWVDDGATNDFIRDQLVTVFGEDIDYNPPADGISALVWILPVVGFTAAVGGLVVVFRRWREEGLREASKADQQIVAAARRSAES